MTEPDKSHETMSGLIACAMICITIVTVVWIIFG